MFLGDLYNLIILKNKKDGNRLAGVLVRESGSWYWVKFSDGKNELCMKSEWVLDISKLARYLFS